MLKYTFESELDKYIHNLVGLHDSLPRVMAVVERNAKKEGKEFVEFLKSAQIETVQIGENTVEHAIPLEKYHDFIKLRKRIKSSQRACVIVPKTFVVSLVSQYDAFLGGLIRAIYCAQPKKLNTSQKPLLLSQLLEFGSIEEAKEHVIEKEVEAVLRESHVEQIAILEKLLDNTQLTNGLDIWPIFIELTERRNLFVHCDGVVSSQYLAVCQKHNIKFETPCKVGEHLFVSPEYFESAYSCLFEFGVKLAHVMWRKLLPEERSNADISYNSVCFELIANKEYALAIRLLEFGVSYFKQFSSENIRLCMVINLAQANKWSGNQPGLEKIITGVDWSALGDKFKLSKAVLVDSFGEACTLMRKIGKDGDINKSDYKDWPLFQSFIQTREFEEAFEEIYGEKFMITETTETPAINVDGCVIQEVAATKTS